MTRRTGHGCVERGYPERLGTKFKSIRAKMREQRKTFDPVVPPIVGLKEGKNPISRTLLREIYFGLLLSTKRAQFHPGPKRHVCPFQGHLHTRKRGIKKLWLVFSYHGKSLEKTLYKEQEPWLRSIEWDEYRVSLDGQETMRSIMEQLLYALGSLHEVGITHRDLKPGNDLWDGSTILLIDFGSAIDTFSMKFLYGRSGPGRAQQSPIYSAPESFLYSNWKGYFRPNSADMWSLGVLMMELIGVEETFERPSTTLDALLRQYFQLLQPVEWSIVAKLLYYTEMCILKQTVWPFCVGRRWPPSILNL